MVNHHAAKPFHLRSLIYKNPHMLKFFPAYSVMLFGRSHRHLGVHKGERERIGGGDEGEDAGGSQRDLHSYQQLTPLPPPISPKHLITFSPFLYPPDIIDLCSYRPELILSLYTTY
jgi:hypothetical protein